VIVPGTDGVIYCLKAGDGKKIWTYATNMPIVSSATAIKDRVLISGSDGHCRALDVTTGKLLWDYDKIKGFVETKPLMEGSKIYFGSWGNEFYSIDIMTGKLEWKWSAGHTNRMFSPAACWAVCVGQRVFIVAPDRYITVLNKDDGTVIWRNYDTSHFVRESMGVSRDKRLVYVKTFQGKIQAIDAAADGRKVVWTATDDIGFDVCPSPINEYNGNVFVPSQSGVVYAFDNTDGHLLWKHKISNCLINTVQPIDKHSAIASTMDGKLVRLMY
jgi:outer membrane protein assembly factor BamB